MNQKHQNYELRPTRPAVRDFHGLVAVVVGAMADIYFAFDCEISHRDSYPLRNLYNSHNYIDNHDMIIVRIFYPDFSIFILGFHMMSFYGGTQILLIFHGIGQSFFKYFI